MVDSELSYVHSEADDSYCCSGHETEYWWVHGGALSPNDALEHVLDLVEAELTQDPKRYWSERSLDEWIGRVEALLINASKGRLLAVTEIKSIVRALPRRVFEIRISIGTLRATRMGDTVVATSPKDEPLRIYHGETTSLPFHALGVHLHLKETGGAIKDLQNAEIDRALERLDAGESTKWGLPH